MSHLVTAQISDNSVALLARLDSVRQSNSISKHFAAIYFETTIGAVNYFSRADERVQQLMERLELQFASYFFRAAEAYAQNEKIPPAWQAYYQDSSTSSLRYILYGINAHINGDIWQALTGTFTAAEIEELKPWYFAYYNELQKEYDTIYRRALAHNKKLKLLHTLTEGLDKAYGKIMLKHWRNRQIRLAVLYYNDRVLFEKRLKKLQRKTRWLDRLIRKNI
ncbi:MAG: hypothetical protein J0L56_16575 [Chitinophagales bacterium]|nr:hypothetical protein [Chitinophagales bacterium]